MTDVPIVMTTYFEPGTAGAVRATGALATAETWRNKGGLSRIIIADDYSDPAHLGPFLTRMHDIYPSVSVLVAAQPSGVGHSLNRGMQKAFVTSDMCIYAVDDWELAEHFDPQPWVDIIESEQDIGCIRLGPPHPGLRGTVRHLDGDQRPWLLNLEPYGYAVAQRPALWHRRFYDALGWWKENCSALECEKDLSDRWAAHCSAPGDIPTPSIALALPHPWYHINASELSSLDPKERTIAR